MPNQPASGNRGHYISSIPDSLWAKVQAVAAERGESVSAAVRRALERYTTPITPPPGMEGKVIKYAEWEEWGPV